MKVGFFGTGAIAEAMVQGFVAVAGRQQFMNSDILRARKVSRKLRPYQLLAAGQGDEA
jgi:pyrroline-5-carboxylate reductase